jgi:hypothetical protein
MTRFISGETETNRIAEPMLFYESDLRNSGGYGSKQQPREFSETAQNVFSAGRELWGYYHSRPDCVVNASLHDIKAYFQGYNSKGKMNSQSSDETYTLLITRLREQLKLLAKKIEPKVYEHGFLKK